MNELLVTPKSVEHALHLFKIGADAVLVGEDRFSLRLPTSMSIDEIKEVVANKADKKVYVNMNAIFHNEHLQSVETYMKSLMEVDIDGIYFGDPSIVMYNKELGDPFELIWNAETIATNSFQCDYWFDRGAVRSYLARELNEDEMIEIKQLTKAQVEIQVHGATCMFHSKRPLLGHYYLYQEKAMKIENRDQPDSMLLYDEERGNKYPIYEDVQGTHIFSPNDMMLLEELEVFLEANIDVFRIDGILRNEDYINEVTKNYRKAIDLYHEDRDAFHDELFDLAMNIEEIQPTYRPLDTGFMFKQTVY